MQGGVSLTIRQINMATVPQRQFHDTFVPILGANDKDRVSKLVPRVGVDTHIEDLFQLLKLAEPREGEDVN